MDISIYTREYVYTCTLVHVCTCKYVCVIRIYSCIHSFLASDVNTWESRGADNKSAAPDLRFRLASFIHSVNSQPRLTSQGYCLGGHHRKVSSITKLLKPTIFCTLERLCDQHFGLKVWSPSIKNLDAVTLLRKLPQFYSLGQFENWSWC